MPIAQKLHHRWRSSGGGGGAGGDQRSAPRPGGEREVPLGEPELCGLMTDPQQRRSLSGVREQSRGWARWGWDDCRRSEHRAEDSGRQHCALSPCPPTRPPCSGRMQHQPDQPLENYSSAKSVSFIAQCRWDSGMSFWHGNGAVAAADLAASPRARLSAARSCWPSLQPLATNCATGHFTRCRSRAGKGRARAAGG